jgi:hypothetical protein
MISTPSFFLKKFFLKSHVILAAGVLLAPMADAADSSWPDIRVEVKADQPAAVKQSLEEAAVGRTASSMGAIPRWNMK